MAGRDGSFGHADTSLVVARLEPTHDPEVKRRVVWRVRSSRALAHVQDFLRFDCTARRGSCLSGICAGGRRWGSRSSPSHRCNRHGTSGNTGHPSLRHAGTGTRTADNDRLGQDRGCARIGRRLSAVPSVRQPLLQSQCARGYPAFARRECHQPRARAARRRAHGRSVLRLHPPFRHCSGTPRQRQGDPRRRFRALRCGRSGGHDRTRKRRCGNARQFRRPCLCKRPWRYRKRSACCGQSRQRLRCDFRQVGSRQGVLYNARSRPRGRHCTSGLRQLFDSGARCGSRD